MSQYGQILIVLAAMAAATVRAGPAVQHSFDAAEPHWQLVTSDAGARVLSHDHVPQGARNTGRAERFVVAAAAGKSAIMSFAVHEMPVIDELEARLWVKASRPGVQLALRIVLPRSVDPTTGSGSAVIVRSSLYDRPGHWQQLALGDVPKLLANEVRVMRAVPGAAVDSREALVNAVVLIVPGDPGGVEVITDDLEVDGILAVRTGARAAANPIELAADPRTGRYSDRLGATLAAGSIHRPGEHETMPGHPAPSVRFEGATLIVEGRPFTPRAIDWRGEPLKFIAERGFNSVRLSGLPTDEQTVQARQHNLWFLCAPPGPDELVRTKFDSLNTERVLAWYLADEAAEVDPTYFRRWAEQLRAHDAAARPLLIAPHMQWSALSKSADILVGKHPLSARVGGHEFSEWYRQQRQSSRPGTPIWQNIPTQLGNTACRQAAALSGQAGLMPNIDFDRVEMLMQIAMTQGCRGFIFESHSSLADSDPATRRRALLLEHLNHQLAVWEPWLAGGKVIGRVTSTKSTSSDATVSAVLMQVDFARLLVPLIAPDTTIHGDGTFAAAADLTTNARRAFVVPGIPDSNEVFLLSPAGLRPLDVRRVAGGTSIVLEPGDDGCILMTEDAHVIHAMRLHVARNAANAARLQRELATLESTTVSSTGRTLAQLGMRSAAADREVASAANHLREVDRMLAAGQLEQAYHLTAVARHDLYQAAAAQRSAMPQSEGFTSFPLAVCYDTLPEHATFLRSLDKLRGGDNMLYGGDFEDLSNLIQFGWQHVNHPLPGVTARAELSPITPRHGSYCLQLLALGRGFTRIASPHPQKLPVAAVSASSAIYDPFRPDSNATAALPSAATASALESSDGPSDIPSAPIWITAPPIPMQRSSIVEISGWIRVPKPLAGSASGLEIIDSLGGPELAIRALETSAWAPFRIVRAVPESTELNLAFLLSGLGSAQIDGVMVRRLLAPVPRRLPPVK